MPRTEPGVRWTKLIATQRIVLEGLPAVQYAVWSQHRQRVADSLVGESWTDVERSALYRHAAALRLDDITIEYLLIGKQRTLRPAADTPWHTIALGADLRVGYRIVDAALLEQRPFTPPPPVLDLDAAWAVHGAAEQLVDDAKALAEQASMLLMPPGLVAQPTVESLLVILSRVEAAAATIRTSLPGLPPLDIRTSMP